MPAAEPLAGWRIVAAPAALDSLVTDPDSTALRLAPDDVLVVGSPAPPGVDDPHAIVEPDTGWSAFTFTETAFADGPAHRVEWALPSDRPALAQGLVAGVPAKVWFAMDGTVLVMCATAHAHDLGARIGADA